MKLPISMMVIITILVLVVVVLIAFFVMTSGSATGRTAMQTQFTEGCLFICSMEQRTSVQAMSLAYSPLRDWQHACEELYGIETGAYLQCLERCSCGSLPTLCERLQRAANDVGANCPLLCEAALMSDATKLLYNGCDCKCS